MSSGLALLDAGGDVGGGLEGGKGFKCKCDKESGKPIKAERKGVGGTG